MLENAGTFNVTGSGYLYLGENAFGTSLGGGTIKNDSGATFDFQSASNVYNYTGATGFANAGTLEQTVTTGTTDIQVALTNIGAVSVQTGTLQLDGGGTSTAGTFTVASGATLDFDAGTFTLSGDAFSGAGVVQVSGGTLTTATSATIASGLSTDGRLDRRRGHADGFGRGDVQRQQLRSGDRNGDDPPSGDDDGFLPQLYRTRRRARARKRGHVQCDGKRRFLPRLQLLWSGGRRRHDPERFGRDVRLPDRVLRSATEPARTHS